MNDEIFRSPLKKGRIAVLLSGRGSNFISIRESVRKGIINAEIALVLSNKESAPGLAAAREFGLDAVFLDPKRYEFREDYDREIIRRLDEKGIDLVCMAGYMRILTSTLCRAYKNRILNIHPALLPAFPGLHVQQKAIDWGVRFSGCTVHFVAEEVDAGPIVLQAVVPVLQDDLEDTLAARILVEEHKIYPEDIRLYFEGKLEIRGRKVFILQSEP